MAYVVHIVGKRSTLITRGREARLESVGQEWININQHFLVRSGDENLVTVPRLSNCFNSIGDTHRIKAGDEGYEVDRGYICRRHMGKLMTLDELKNKFNGIYYKDITILDTQGDPL